MDETNYCETCFYSMNLINVRVVDYIENPFATCANCGEATPDDGCLLATAA